MSRREFLNKTVMPVGTVLFLAFLFRPLCMVHERDLAAWAALQGYRKQKKLCP